jgi:hypothetical protein
MSYSFDTRSSSKWDTIQEDVADMYIEDVEEETEEEDFFGFGKAIQIDHLTDEEVDMVLDMFGDKN